ncbi:MAG: heavy-metal-associated domain-containing protein [Betaproteobacteria bacterium]|nr:heavy-metal-associated domain-containing protein [Betaproteobacteria bacterium]MDE2124387.1 heavy-metal-associated domain-containing protein [Betaproteobacteria bacterium]MDE2186775.1 heavy-metal-associated domain-containing protein [Betaproteobacteria bacterium]MDE2325380.1 heavy-metal-associated domain-containing protein [Betaproteobacteria bacterium]
MKTVTFKVTGMHCNGCAGLIQGLLQRQEGVKACTTSFEDSFVRAAFDPALVDEKTLRELIEMAGYKLVSQDAPRSN